MKILEINGSPRNNGNTQCILDLSNKRMEEIMEGSTSQIEYEIIHIYDQNLKWCKGCRNCFNLSEEKCPQKDTLLWIKDKMEQADCIIMASPIYVEDVSGGMKNFLDRMAFNCHRPFLKGKQVYCFTSSASVASSHALKTMKRAILSWGGRIVATDQFQMGAKSSRENAERLFGRRIRKVMEVLISQFLTDKVTLSELISFRIQKSYWGKKEKMIDYRYWKSQGWLRPECTYYKDIKINCMKQNIAKIISKVVGRYIR